jgi:hypothetical protein
MIRKQKNISFLILFLLTLVFYPGIIQLVHVHSNLHVSIEQGEHSTFIPEQETCAVCDFQFVSFIGNTSEILIANLEHIDVTDSIIPPIFHVRHLTFFSLRAPPEA